MLARSVLNIAGVLLFYFVLAYLSMLRVVQQQGVRDYFKLPFVEWASVFANAIPVVAVLYRLWAGTQHKVYLHRVSGLYLLKGVVQFVTVVPAVAGTAQCVHRTFWTMVAQGSCADMMFSGHTGLTFLMTPPNERPVVVTTVAIFILFAEMHYMSDIIVGVIVASWLEYVLPLEERPTPVEKSAKNRKTSTTNLNPLLIARVV